MKSGLFVAAMICGMATGAARAGEDPLEDAVIAQARSQAKGAKQTGEFLRGQKPKTDFQILLEADRCYWFSGASEGFNKLYMYLWAPGASFFSPRLADSKTEGQGTLAWCTTVGGLYRFQVKTEGKGQFVVGVFEKEGPRHVDKPVVAKEEGPDLGKICDKQAKAVATGAHRVGEFMEGQGSSFGHDDRIDQSIMLDGGKCYWVIGCGDPEHVKSLYLYLWGPDNKRITEAKSDSSTPNLGHCPRESGMFKVQSKMNSGSGKYKVGIYVK